MSSADYRAYIQAEIEECRRLSDVYQGVDHDINPPAEHIAIDHLDSLLSAGVPRDLYSLYLREYDELRATQRAVAIGRMSRKDFYDVAAQEVLIEREFLSSKLSFNTYFANQFLKDSAETFKAELEEETADYVKRKNEAVDRLKVQSGKSSGSNFTDEDLIKVSMRNVPNVNSKGVSTATTVVRD